MVHALDLVRNVAAEVVDVDRRIGVGREEVGEAQRHHRRGQARLHVERAVAAARVVGVARDLREGVARQRAVVDEEERAVPVRDLEQRTHLFGVPCAVRKPFAGNCAPTMPGSPSARSSSAAAAEMSTSGSAAWATKRPSCFWQIFERLSLTSRHSGTDTSSGWDSIQQNVPSSDSTLVLTPWRSILAR